MTDLAVVQTPHGPRFAGLPTTLVSGLRRTVERTPQAIAVVDLKSGVRLTYVDLWHRAHRLAAGLRDRGIRPGDRVAIRLPNGAAWCLAYLGTAIAGAAPVPVNTRLTDAEVDYIVSDAGATLVLDDPARLPIGLNQTVDSRASEDAEAIAAVFYTSGTTGRPKGAMISHRAMISAAEQVRRALGLAPDEATRNLIAAPLFHILAFGMQWVPAMLNGGSVAIMPGFETGAWIDAIRDERIDVLNGVPAMYHAALRHPSFAALDTSGVRVLSYGAAPTPPQQLLELRAAFPTARLAPGYGLTEAPCVTGLGASEDPIARARTVGSAVAGTELRVEGPDAAEGIGQLLVRGPQLMTGYWGRPADTAAVLIDGWLHTGDLVRIDETGHVQILDRRTDLINRGGENVYSVEVEATLAAFPGVGEVAVVGVPDERLGSQVGAVVVPRPGIALDVTALVEFAATELASFKVPRFVDVRAEPLPRSAAGKVDKEHLRRSATWMPIRSGSAS